MSANLKALLVDELRDIYYAEKQLVKALPKLAKAASSPDLRKAFEDHLGQTEQHVTRLEKAFNLLEEPARGKTCYGILGIVEEGSELITQHGRDKGPALDAGLIAGGQRAEHYEMAVYGSLRAWAETLGLDNVAELLSETLEEEKAADKKLSELAEAGINQSATAGENGSEDREMQEGDGEAGRATSRGGNGRARQARMPMGGNGRSGQASRRTASRR